MPHLKKAGAPGPRSTSSRLLSSSFFPRSLPPATDCCSVFLLLCLSALSQQVTSSVTRGSCIAPQKRALPPRSLCSSLVCSYFKSHNSCRSPLFLHFLCFLSTIVFIYNLREQIHFIMTWHNHNHNLHQHHQHRHKH